MKRAATVTEVRPTTEADRGTVLPPERALSPWVAIDSEGRSFFADSADEARGMAETYNHPLRYRARPQQGATAQ